MKTTSLTIRLDDAVKQDASKLAEELGLSLSNVINGYLKTFIRTREVTFSAPQEEPTEYLLKQLEQSKKDIENGDVSPSFYTIEEALNQLRLSDKNIGDNN